MTSPAADPVDATAPGEDGVTASPSRKLEIIAAAVALVFFIFLLGLATQIELRREPVPGQIDARQWPIMLATLGIVLALVRLAIAFLRPPDSRDDLEPIRAGGFQRLGITLALTLGYVAVWTFREQIHLGIPVFLIITPLFLAALVASYGGRSWRSLILYPLLLTGFAYLLFHTALRIPL